MNTSKDLRHPSVYTCLCINQNNCGKMRASGINPTTDCEGGAVNSKKGFDQGLMNRFHLDEVQCTALHRIILEGLLTYFEF